MAMIVGFSWNPPFLFRMLSPERGGSSAIKLRICEADCVENKMAEGSRLMAPHVLLPQHR
jgi:hypothetical protein